MIKSNNDQKFNLYKSLKNIVKRMKNSSGRELNPGCQHEKDSEYPLTLYITGVSLKYLSQKILGSIVRNVSLALRSIIRFGKYGQLSRVNNAKLNRSEIKNVCAHKFP